VNPIAQIEPVSYRLIITRRNASEILVTGNACTWALPRVEIPLINRVAEQLTTEVKCKWKLKTYLQFMPSLSAHGENPQRANYAVLESIGQAHATPIGTRWVSSMGCEPILSGEESTAIEESLRGFESHRVQSKAGPFGRPGWLSELFVWVQQQLSPAGLRANGEFRQCSGGATFSLIRFETDGPAVWFKATGQPTLHELPITVMITRLFPKNLPPMLGVHRSWNGWLSQEVSDTTLDQCIEPSFWERAAKALAELQIASINQDSELLNAQCKDLRVSTLASLVNAFVSRMEEFMTLQQKPSPPPLGHSELSFLESQLEEGCSLLMDLGFPDTLGHMDINPGNILICPDRCVFLDWAEGSVTCPLFSLEYLAEHFRRCAGEDSATSERIARAYFGPWCSFFRRDQLVRAREWSPLIAVFAHAVSCNPWRLSDGGQLESQTGYFRSLTRRMHREAIRLSERSEHRVAAGRNHSFSFRSVSER
jgi:hypothetical protein